MARLNVWLPDDLAAKVRAELDAVNFSKLLQEALGALLECDHDELACRRCGSSVEAAAIAVEALGAFFADLWWSLDELVCRVGTAEGAAKVTRDVGRRHGIPDAERAHLLRPSKAAREEAAEREWAARQPVNPEWLERQGRRRAG